MVLAPEVRSIVKALKGSNSCEEIAQILECDVESVVSCIRECELLEGKTATLRLPQRPKAAATPVSAQEEEKRREVGRPKVLENRQLVERMLADHPHFTSIDVQRELARHGIEVSRRTLQRRISEIRSKNNQPQTCSPSPKKSSSHGLSEEAKRKRLAWAKAHQDWTVRDWRNIFNMDDLKFVDESSPPKEIFLDTLMGPEGSGSVCSDLNLLEQLMAIIQPRIQNQAPNNVGEFRAVLYDVWHCDQDMVDKIEMLYESMTWRVSAVLRSGGDQTEFC
ncbi:uncharacterized protein LOC108140393 [Drosophila elegans]|uniref:uncharacterized protein LOC108140393 n=1 Tax=Drosophila elegans TaxID=30023 RepID=UPI0007E61732|nr:uncharacterized protein LOC108140393 [Drosophila elegans]